MRVLCHVLFLTSYAWSSYAVTQERTSLLVQEFEHSTSRTDETQISKDCKSLQDGFPKYRQAKPKAGAAVYSGDTAAVYLLPHASPKILAPQTVSLKSQFSGECFSSRAPALFDTVAFETYFELFYPESRSAGRLKPAFAGGEHVRLKPVWRLAQPFKFSLTCFRSPGC